MPPFKDEISPALVERLAAELAAADPAFPADRFAADAAAGLGELELMDRVRHVAAALVRHLGTLAAAGAAFDGALGSERFSGWMTLPCTYAVAELGRDEPDVALPLLARLTPRFSSEGAVRPLIERHPEAALRHLAAWTEDPDEHVRRLASEGTRPRLPWAPRLPASVRDPRAGIALLDRLHDDPSAYVRRSVANHLNDIAKDHPDLAVETARRWLADGGEHTPATVRHGLRTLVKAGRPDALALLGYDATAAVRLVRFCAEPARVPIGGTVALEIVLVADGAPAPVVVDLRVHHAGARGPRAPKVFKLARRTLRPGVPERIERRHHFREVTVRRLYPGPHRLEVQVNGRVLGGAVVALVEP